MTQAFDIVIVGAGMVGAALATGLGRDGFRVALVDRAPEPAFTPEAAPDIRVSALSAGTERYLQSLGAWNHILAMRATPYRRLGVWDETPHPLRNLLPRTANQVEFDAARLNTSHLGHIVENSVTQKGLWQAAETAPSVTILAGNGVSGIHQTADLAEITLENGQQLTATLVIGADGGQSRVRDMAGIGVVRNQYGQQAMVISVRYQGEVKDITWQGFYPSGPRAFLPLHSAGSLYPGECWGSLVWYDAPEELARLKSLSHEALMAEIQRGFPAELPRLTHIEGRASFPIARQHAKNYSAGRIVLTGDAAHTINPLAGQGVNLGFQDAQCLQRILVEARRAGRDLADPSVLGSYEQQRRPANRRMMFAMDAFYHLFSNQAPPLHLLRNLGLGTVRALPFTRNRVARYAMGIDDELPAIVRQLTERLPGLNRL